MQNQSYFNGRCYKKRGSKMLKYIPCLLIAFAAPKGAICSAQSKLVSELVFPVESWHNHGSCIVECPNGDFLVCWFHGSGERKSDDVKILGARRTKGGKGWSKPFLMADTPDFPDTNCCMTIDPKGRLWLLWPTIQANLMGIRPHEG